MRPRLQYGRRIRWTDNTTARWRDMERERENWLRRDGQGRKKKDGGKAQGSSITGARKGSAAREAINQNNQCGRGHQQ